MWPAAAKSRSISPAWLPDIEEKTSRGPRPGTHSSTVRSATPAGGAPSSCQEAASR